MTGSTPARLEPQEQPGRKNWKRFFLRLTGLLSLATAVVIGLPSGVMEFVEPGIRRPLHMYIVGAIIGMASGAGLVWFLYALVRFGIIAPIRWALRGLNAR